MIILERIAKKEKLFSKKSKEIRLNKAKRPKLLKGVDKNNSKDSSIHPLKSNVLQKSTKSIDNSTSQISAENIKNPEESFLLDDTLL